MDPLQGQGVASDDEARLQDQRQQRTTDSRFQQMESHSSHLAFQNSDLSPALLLLPSSSVMEQNTDYSLFQQSDVDFAPLSAYTDMSVASDFQSPPQELTSQTLDQASLSQYPLDETRSSCCSLSQHSVSPAGTKARASTTPSLLAPVTQEIASKSVVSCNLENVDNTYFLSKDVPAHQLMQSLQKDVGVLSSSNSTNSSKTSEIKELSTNLNHDPSLIRGCPPGEASVSQQQPQMDKNATKSHLSDVFNVTVGSRSTEPDESSEALRQELLSIQRRGSQESSEQLKSYKTPKEFATPFPTKIPKLKSLTKETLSSGPLPGPFSTGIVQRLREHDLWSSGNQTGIDGSYLGFIPQSQSTPGVFKAPPKSNVKSKFQQLSDIESTKESLIQSTAEVSPAPASVSNPEANNLNVDEPTCDKVQSLPSLTYMQKVDAWRANQNSGNTSLFDSLALKGFTGVSPKKKAYDAVSDSLNRILSQQVVKINQNVMQNPSVDVFATSFPRREEAVGSAPSDKDNIAATQSASPFNRSQSHSSLSTVVMSVKKEHTTEARRDKCDTEEADVQQPPTNERELSPLVISLGQFSDVTLSNSQDSSNSGQKIATSIGTSSVSLEVDNYDPYWSGKLSTPPPQYKPRELNIEERIPVYLQNLGIDQSPSTILTPFAPRGPIREPEFSPTEICTIKGSTPTKSIQPSEGGTPHKAEFSRSSLQSMDSSFSVPLSTEAQVIRQDHSRRTSSSSDKSAALHFNLALHPHPDDDILSRQRRDSSQSPDNVGPSLDQEDKNLERPSAEQNGQISFVSSGAFSDIRKLLSQAENLVSPRSSTASDRFLLQRREASFISALSTEESKSQSSLLWTRSSSDSALTTRERLTGGESVAPVRQSGVVSRSAGLSLVLNKSVQRAEPEGCSAAPPDRIPPPQPQVQPPSPSVPIATSDPELNKETSQDSPVQSSTSSPVPVESMSDRSSIKSSESSLAIRVAKLLQTESPATMVSSTTSVDLEEGRAREWLKQMISGQKCEPLQLDQEDRRRIEEIKRELLLKNPKLGYASTDTESSAASSLRHLKGQTPIYQMDAHRPKVLDSKQPSEQSKSCSTNIPQPGAPQHEEIEAKVREIATREGVILPKTKALTSITISTCRRSTSPSPSTSPAAPRSPTSEPLHLNQLTTDEGSNAQVSPSLDKDELRSYDITNLIALENQVLNENSRHASRQDTVGGHNEHSSSSEVSLQQNNSNFEPFNKAAKTGVDDLPNTEQVGAKYGHISQVRLTLSPKPLEHIVLGSSVFSQNVSFPQRHFVPLRRSPSTASSPDEGVGLSSPPEWQEVPKRQERYNTSESLTQQRIASSVHVPPKPLAVDSTSVPHLLPYKPLGSEELFYVPQTEADSSNDTTMESTHTGSDDALPPHFSSDVLGRQDPGLDRGVTIRHTEGIYSKRLTQPRFTMTERGHRDAVDKPEPGSASQTPKPSSPVFTPVPLTTNIEVLTTSRRDQGTSPVSFFSRENLPLPNKDRLLTENPDHFEIYQEKPPSTSQQNVSSLNQLWHKFSERWKEEESRTITEREASLLERLERLSRIIQNTQDSTRSEQNMSSQELHVPQKSDEARDLMEVKRQIHTELNKDRDKERNSGQVLDSLKPLPGQERDVSDTLSSTSMSTVDTGRLVRAFGADRVQRNLRSSSSLSKLYSAISKQKEQEEQTRTPSVSSVTEDSSVTVGSGSSTCTYMLPRHRGPSKTLVSKRAVKLVSKGIQAGDLEIVSNGTRRHTRDVGTTFPSPSDRAPRHNSSSSLDRELKTHKSLTSKSQKPRKSHSSPPKRYPHGISWFIAAEELKTDGHKENEPEQWRPSAVWFEPLSKKPPWREPLRQRPVEEQRNGQTTDSSAPGNKKSSALSQITLQDALRLGRPDFVSRSRQRLERLALQVEERHLQTLFNQEREVLFMQPGGPGRLPRPAGTAHLRRAVPRKEMIQRSKQIYENLPEVRRRREEEQRRAEYRSYRLNAQLYNKRITNRVLGKRSAWS